MHACFCCIVTYIYISRLLFKFRQQLQQPDKWRQKSVIWFSFLFLCLSLMWTKNEIKSVSVEQAKVDALSVFLEGATNITFLYPAWTTNCATGCRPGLVFALGLGGWVRARAWCHPMNIQIYVYLSCCRQSQLLCTYVLVCNVLVQTRWGWTCWANGFASADRLKRGTIFCILGHWNGILEHTQNDDHFFSTL